MALPALLFALLAGQEAVSTAPPEPTPAEAQAATANALQSEYTPEGAPKDDYNFVAWCHGVLTGHMALAERIQSVLPLDEVQQKIGKSYLKGYEEALATGRRGRSAAELDAADAIRAAARANWTTAMKADIQLGADTYLAWQLPGRCEHAAKRVAGRQDLFRMIATPVDDESVGAGAPVNDASDVPPVSSTPRPTAAAPAAATPVMTPAVAAPVVTPPAPDSSAPVFTSADLPAGDAAVATSVQPVEASVAEAPVEAVFTTPDADAAPAEAPAEVTTVAAADTAPAAQAPAAEAPKPADGRVVRMPSKGRLFPWGKRE